MSVTIEKLDTGFLVTSSNQSSTGMMPGSAQKRAALSSVDDAFEKARELFDDEQNTKKS